MCCQALNKWALSTWPNFELNKLKFPLLWRQKPCKTGKRIIFVKVLSKELSLNYILQPSCLKNQANHLVNLLVTHGKSNAAEEPVPAQLQQFVPGDAKTPSTQRPCERPRLPEHIYQAKME